MTPTRHYLKHLCFALALVFATNAAAEDGQAAWAESLQQRLAKISTDYPGQLGVFVKDLQTGESFSLRGDEPWYLASGIKVPVAIAVMRKIESGELSLDTRVTLKASDYVDGAGETNWQKPGTRLKVSYLLEQMMVHSDNTASDTLIRVVGLEMVNQVAQSLAPEGLGEITSLADVRRHAYSGFHQGAFNLDSGDFFELKKADESKRMLTLARILKVEPEEFGMADLAGAFDAYYATGLNGGRLRAFGSVLEALVEGEALGPETTGYLLDLMARAQTGAKRIKAGLPDDIRFVHKTGTQHARACDLGVATRPESRGRHIVIIGCSRGAVPVRRAESALEEVGRAVAESGVLDMRPQAAGSLR